MLIITGSFSLHRLGFGFVTPSPSELKEDVFIPASKTINALDGDTVEVKVSPKRKKNKGPEGEIVKVIKRYKQTYMCICVLSDEPGKIVAFLPGLGLKKTVLLKNKETAPPQRGDRLEIKVEKWGKPEDPVIADITQNLGSVDCAEKDNLFAALEFQLSSGFDEAVIKESQQFASEVSEKDKKGRVDFTADDVITIDPDTAKDFDDALSLRIDDQGNFHLNVHIADVSHYVKPGTALDAEARKRGNSTYLIGNVLPMLPKSLSNGLCSLKEGVERLSVSVVMVFDPQGTRLSYKLTRGVIKSKKRFTYKNALDIIEERADSPHKLLLQNFVKLARLLKQKKRERGCLELELDDLVLKVDEEGNPTGYEVVQYDITHQLVEEFMLQANEVVATDLDKSSQGGIYRVHEDPDPANIKDFFLFAQSLGIKVPQQATEKDIGLIFAMAKNTEFEQIVSTAYIRCLKLAKYSEQNLGHFSLFLDHYTHFTSPIRRYSDLVVHRQLFNETNYDEDELIAIAAHLSKTERISFKAEQHALTWKKLRFLSLWKEEDPARVYSGMLTRIKSKGMLANIAPLNFDYFVEVRALKHDYFNFDATRNLLIGKRTKQVFQIGMACKLKLVKVSLLTLSTDWNYLVKRKKKGNRKST